MEPVGAAPLVPVVITLRPQDSPQQALRALKALDRQIGVRPGERFVVGALPPEMGTMQRNIVLIGHTNPATARNLAVRQATAEIVAFTDADCIPAPDWLETLLHPFQDAHIVGVKGTYATRQRGLIARFSQVEYEEKYSRLAKQERIDFIDLYAAAYRRKILLSNGGFDERFPFLGDRELAFRLAARGYRLAFAPGAVVTHDHTATWHAYAVSKFRTGYWKAQVVRRFPQQGIADSHTPQTLKLQMGLLAALAPTSFAAIRSRQARKSLLAGVLALLATALPFLRRAWHREPAVLPLALPLLTVRAVALMAGFTWGILRPRPAIVNKEATIGGWQYVAKRLLDLVGGILGGGIFVLMAAPIAIAVKLDSPGPVFFKQERIGAGGRPFQIVKFRSMRADAEATLGDLVDLDALEEPAFKLKEDPRVTRVGRFLRRWSLDELPQFINVLRGDMSLVGPRPEETRLVARYNDWQRRRLAVKPGITGPMQVRGRGDLSLDERVRLEVDYIENYSLLRDIMLLAQTFPAVARGDGAR